MIGIGIRKDSSDIPVGQGRNEGATFGGGIKNCIQNRGACFPGAKGTIVTGAAGFFGKGLSNCLSQPLAEEGGVHEQLSGEMGYGMERRSASKHGNKCFIDKDLQHSANPFCIDDAVGVQGV
jgi:hypothetical protein